MLRGLDQVSESVISKSVGFDVGRLYMSLVELLGPTRVVVLTLSLTGAHQIFKTEYEFEY